MNLKTGTLVYCWWECGMEWHLWQRVLQFLKRSNIELLCDPVIPFLGIYPTKLKAGTQTEMYTPVFVAALFT